MTEEQRNDIMVWAPVDKIAYLLEYIDEMLVQEGNAQYEQGYTDGMDEYRMG